MKILPPGFAGAQFYAQGLDLFYFGIYHNGGEAVVRNPVAQHAAGFFHSLKNRHGVTEDRQVMRGAHAPGPAAYDRCFFSVLRGGHRLPGVHGAAVLV